MGTPLMVYQILVPLGGLFAGLAVVFFLSLFVAPYRQRNELRTIVESRTGTTTDLDAQYYREQTISLAEVGKAGSIIIIKDKTFERCTISGPCIVTFDGGCVLSHTTWDVRPEVFLYEITENRKVIGVMQFESCIFRDCRFSNTGVFATTSQKQLWDKDFAKREAADGN